MPLDIGERELTLTRTFDAPRELVFRLWTDPAHAVHWWGPRDYPADHMEMDVRPGGAWRHRLRAKDDGHELWQGGVFREVSPPGRLVFTFAWDAEGERGLETVVEIDFAEQGGKTLMTFRQSPFQSLNERDGHGGGWNSAFDRLSEHLKQMNGRAL